MSSTKDPMVGAGAMLGAMRHELHHLRSHWWWFTLLGGLLVVSGTLAIVFPLVSSVAVTAMLAVLLMVSGVAMIVSAFWAGKWSGLLLQLLAGILYLIAGFVMTDNPLFTEVVITVFIAMSFVLMGAFRIVAGLMLRFPEWGWVVLNGVVTMLAGIIIYRHLPEAALWIIGLLVGLEMLFNGWAWIMLSLALRSGREETA